MNGFSPDLSLEGSAQLIFPSGGQSESSCASVTIRDDDLFEGEEMYCLTLQSSDPDIIVGSTSFTCVVIADNNLLRIGFQPSDYTITEGSPVEVCVEVLEGSSAVPITLTVDATEGTAEGSDYDLTQPAELVLFAGETRTCTDIMTTDDEIYEDDESFFATLSSTNEDVLVTINSAVILITDDDGKMLFPW
jgi:hypothetical protein